MGTRQSPAPPSGDPSLPPSPPPPPVEGGERERDGQVGRGPAPAPPIPQGQLVAPGEISLSFPDGEQGSSSSTPSGSCPKARAGKEKIHRTWLLQVGVEIGLGLFFLLPWASPGGSDSKESVRSAGDPGLAPGWGRSPGAGMATHSSTLVRRIQWTGHPGGLQSMGSQRVGHD